MLRTSLDKVELVRVPILYQAELVDVRKLRAGKFPIPYGICCLIQTAENYIPHSLNRYLL